MKFGYARVSTHEQCLDIQIEKLTAAGCDEILQEKISGAKEERKELSRLLDKLRPGDTVCVVRLDRLGRRMLQLVKLINEFKDKKINFVSLENNIDTSTAMGMVIFNIMAAISEMERELIRERSKAGLEAAARRGRKGGRPPSLTPEKKDLLITLLRNEDAFSWQQICKMVGITRSVYFRSVREISSFPSIES
jgi:DNA invertase Pin-like site-specific DNA recombinase